MKIPMNYRNIVMFSHFLSKCISSHSPPGWVPLAKIFILVLEGTCNDSWVLWLFDMEQEKFFYEYFVLKMERNTVIKKCIKKYFVVRKEGKGKRLLNFVEGKGKFLIFSVSLSCNRKTIYLYQSLFMRAFYVKKEWRARARRKDTSTQVIQAKRKVRHLFLRMWCYLF